MPEVEERTMKFPMKYSRDGGNRITVGDFVSGLRKLINDKANDEKLCDYIDEEFLYGAWGYFTKEIPPLMLADIRGIMVGMYKMPQSKCLPVRKAKRRRAR
jgi:hypothetical protein